MSCPQTKAHLEVFVQYMKWILCTNTENCQLNCKLNLWKKFVYEDLQFIKIVQLIKKKFDVSKICLENVMLLYSKEIKGLNMCYIVTKDFSWFQEFVIHQRKNKHTNHEFPQKLLLIIIPNQHIRMISEWSCNTKDWSNEAENSALHQRNNLQMLYLWSNKCRLDEHKTLSNT